MTPHAKLRWPTAIDGASDGLLVAFAVWTVFYEVALAGQFTMLWAGWPWLVLAVTLSVHFGLRSRLRLDTADDAPSTLGSLRVSPSLVVMVLGAMAILVTQRERWGVWPVATLAIVLLAVQMWPWRIRGVGDRRAEESTHSPSAVSPAAHVFAAVASLGFGVLGLFLLRPDADDAFYVNRATWVATHGTAATNDTMFGPNTLPASYGGGIPTPSIEALQGVVAHALGVQAPTLCYVLAVPVLGALCGWTTWRLVRAWAPRRHLLAMAVAMVFLLASAESIVGNYSLGRIWQGKATACAVVLPLVWLLLSRTMRRATRADLGMLVVAGVAFAGLTTASALMAPVIGGAALVAAGLTRSRSLALGAVAFLFGPLANGVAQVVGPVAIGGTAPTVSVDALGALDIAFNGSSVAMLLLALAAVVLAPRIVSGPTGTLLGCGALATMVALLPGVFDLANLLTGAGPVAWRLAITMPTWVLVGLLVNASTAHRVRGTVQTAWAGALIVIPVLFGTWLWSASDARLTDRPTWKVDQPALGDVRAVRDLDLPGGLWLLPPQQMEILSISTVQSFSVVPRVFYLPALREPESDLQARRVLLALSNGRSPNVSKVRGALERLDVSLACVADGDDRGRRILAEAVSQPLRTVGDMRCRVPTP